ncbi:DUF1127 domain-containing protein [Marivita sp. S0852]|uniref:DUF1127 domain-containing protein n=1 Tax=Marivita sp. S0852 TaxID=3373893 RepID=UPI003981FCA1
MYTYLMQKPDYISPARPYANAQQQRTAIGDALRSWVKSAMRRRKQNQMIAMLEALDDRMLDDIGVARDQIRAEVYRLDDRELNMRPVARTHRRAYRHDSQIQQAA